MNELQNRNCRVPSRATIPAGGIFPVNVTGDYCWLYSTTGAEGDIEISVNDGPYAPCPVGLIHRGVIGRDDIGQVKIKNVSAVAVTVIVISGKGAMDISGQVSIVNPTFALSPADLLGITPAPVEHGSKFEQLDDEDEDYDGCNSITVENTGGANLIITTSRGASIVPPGKVVSFTSTRPQDTQGDVNVDATGTTADITVQWPS